MLEKIKIASVALLVAGLATLAWAGPQFPAKGQLKVPPDIASWPVTGASYALSYEGDGSTTFNTVRIDPASYAAYLRTGAFPAGTMLALEVRASLAKVAPAKGGHVQGKVVGHSLHVKDEKAGPGTWTFYTYAAEAKNAEPIARTVACYACHQTEAKQDTVFTQFYPSLLEARTKAQ
jgi:hypothetical protein